MNHGSLRRHLNFRNGTRVLAGFLLLLAANTLLGQAPKARWTHVPHQSESQGSGVIGRFTAVNEQGDLYVLGGFSTTNVTFGNTILTNRGSSDSFIVKFDTGGNFLWVQQIGGPVEDSATSLAIDPEGNCYAAFNFGHSNSISFGGITVTNSSGYTTVITKWNSSGLLLWHKTISKCTWGEVTVDPQGNCIFSGQVYIGRQILAVHKFDSDGNEIWSNRDRDSNWSYVSPVTTDASGNIYMLSKGETRADLVKFSPQGNLLWATNDALHPNHVMFWDIALDEAGNIYWTDILWFSENWPSVYTRGQISKHDPDGNLLWRRSDFKGLPWVSLDAHENPHVSVSGHGEYNGESFLNFAIYKLTPEGETVWQKDFGPQFDPIYASGWLGAVSFDKAGNLYCTGSTIQGFMLDGLPVAAATNSHTMFVARFSYDPPLTVTLSGGQFQLSWPTNESGFVVETSLAPDGGWSALTNAPTLVNGQNVVTQSMTGPQRFFRLRK